MPPDPLADTKPARLVCSVVRTELLAPNDFTSLNSAVYSGLAMAYSNKGDTGNASRYVAEYKKRASAQGVKGIESNPPSPGSPPAFLKYYHDRLLPEWKKAGLP